MLPLEPQTPAHSLGDKLQRWWHNYNEPSSYQCATEEIKVKPRYYSVPPFSRMEADEIMQNGLRLGNEWKAEGKTRKRSYGRD